MRFKIESSLTMQEETVVGYELKDFINDFGGLLGLFIGCSLISFGEIIIALPNALFNKFKDFFSSNKRIKDKNVVAEIQTFW